MTIDPTNGPSPPSPIVRAVDHLAIAVPDLESAVGWYVSGLGFQLLERRLTRGAHTSMISAVLKRGSAVLVLVQGTTPESQVSKYVNAFGPGVQHIAFEVTSLEDTVAHLRSLGIETATPPLIGSGIRQVFLKRDASTGARIELIERAGGDFSDESVERLFRAFEERDLF